LSRELDARELDARELDATSSHDSQSSPDAPDGFSENAGLCSSGSWNLPKKSIALLAKLDAADSPDFIDDFGVEDCDGDAWSGGGASFKFISFFHLLPKPVDDFSFEGCNNADPDGGGSFKFTIFLRLFFQLIPKPVDGLSFEGCDDAVPDSGGSFKFTNFLRSFLHLNPEPVDDAGFGDGEFTTFVQWFQSKSESVDGFGFRGFDNAGPGGGEFTSFVQ
jgi:hypothetical protein